MSLGTRRSRERGRGEGGRVECDFSAERKSPTSGPPNDEAPRVFREMNSEPKCPSGTSWGVLDLEEEDLGHREESECCSSGRVPRRRGRTRD